MANGGYGPNIYPIIPFNGPVYSVARIESATENAYRTVFDAADWDTGTAEDKASWFEITREFIISGLNLGHVADCASLDPTTNLFFFEVLRLSLNSPNLEAP